MFTNLIKFWLGSTVNLFPYKMETGVTYFFPFYSEATTPNQYFLFAFKY